jgi:hypothetical protein
VGNAILLKDRIQEIKDQTNSISVDIVAHSMGGLLAREYLQSDYYQADIDQLVTLGTPHNGSPDSYSRWESGTFALDKLDFFGYVGGKIFKHEAEEAGFEDLYDYIRNRPIESIRELLPVYDYLYDKENKKYKSYPQDYPRNNFLENLNGSKISYLGGVEFMNIIGEKEEHSTITSYNVVNSEDDEKWEYGYPDSFDSLIGDRGIIYGKGDETVPSESSTLPDEYAKYTLTVDSSHNKLPTNAQCDILYFLTRVKVCTVDADLRIPSILSLMAFSPIDILVTLADGRRIGTDPETGEVFNEIEGAYYTGNETDNEFITIPNYEEMEYKISVRGTDDGDFRVEVVSFEDIDGEATETQLENWQGTAVKDEVQNFDFVIGEIAVAVTAGEGSGEEEDNEDDEDEDEDEENNDERTEESDSGGVSSVLASEERDILGNETAIVQSESGVKLAEYSSEQESNQSINNPVVAGEQASKSIRLRVIALMILIGTALLIVTWTVKRRNIKV